jgi:hypothetical protein
LTLQIVQFHDDDEKRSRKSAMKKDPSQDECSLLSLKKIIWRQLRPHIIEVGPLDSVGDVSGKNHLKWGLKKNNPDTRLV